MNQMKKKWESSVNGWILYIMYPLSDTSHMLDNLRPDWGCSHSRDGEDWGKEGCQLSVRGGRACGKGSASKHSKQQPGQRFWRDLRGEWDGDRVCQHLISTCSGADLPHGANHPKVRRSTPDISKCHTISPHWLLLRPSFLVPPAQWTVRDSFVRSQTSLW